MNKTNTAIAVGLAVVVVAIIFIVPKLSPFGSLNAAAGKSAAKPAANTGAINPTSTSTMNDQYQNVTQLETKDDVVGTGATAAPGDKVVVEYTGKLTNGTVFDTSVGKPPITAIEPCPPGTTTGLCFTLGASQVIKGWDEGVVGMKVGGERTLVIPPSLGYGSRGAGSVIPPNSTLIFQVKLLNVQKPQQ